MADTKISALTEDAAPGTDSLVATVDDPAGTPASRKTTLANLSKGINASNIATGTLKHEYGGLEADVSAYSGLVKITGGSTSAATIGIADNNIVEIDDADAADNDYAKLTANGVEGRSYAEVRTDLGLVIGTDVLAEQTIGIANDNLVEMDDADAADDDYAKFTANGLEGRSYAEVLGDIGAAAALGADDNYVTDAEKVVIGNTSGTNTGDEAAADLTTAGVIEIATGAETNTGTDATRAVSPDGLDDWTGSAQVTTLGTIGTGTWEGTAINATYLDGQSGTNTGDESSATTSAEGIAELATAAEVNTGTDTSRVITPDALAGSNLGEKVLEVTCFDYATDTATGDGKGYVTVPSGYDGMNLVAVHARVITAGTTGTTDIQIHNLTQTADMLSTKITIDTTETGSDTGATPAVIDGTNDDVASYDLLRIDVDAVSTTAAKGLIVTMEFRLP